MIHRTPLAARIWLCFALLALAPWPARAESREYEIKAAFLINFIQFVVWPTNAFTNEEAPFCVGVIGEDPFGSALDQTVQGETVNHHKIVVKRWQRVEDCKDCQLVFVSKSENKRVPEILAKIDSHPVATVSEVAGFAKQGGMINFYREQNKVRFEINPASAEKSGLKISSQLLRLGKIVESPPMKN